MRWLIGCLLCWHSTSAQVSFPLKDSSIIKEIDLPSQQPFDTAHSYNRYQGEYIYLSSDNDLYSFFGYDISMKYREFKFGSYHILGERKCKDCNEWTWVIRENSKAFTEIPVSITPGHIGPGLPRNHRPFFGDSVIRYSDDAGVARWFTTGQGDCFASFKYKLFADNFHPVVLLKEYNYWGGCRAGGSFDFTILFNMPPGISYTIKNRVLMERLGDGIEDR